MEEEEVLDLTDCSLKLQTKTWFELFRQDVLGSIKEPRTFEEQVEVLMDKLQPSPRRNLDHKLIHADLENAIQPMFPQADIIFCETGLALKGSDLDVYLANINKSDKPDDLLKALKNLIFQSEKLCDVVINWEMVQCLHIETETLCNLYIDPVYSADIIKYYITLDKKIRPLMIFVKCWGRNSDAFFSEWALYLTVIFYLQHTYSTPSVRDIQNKRFYCAKENALRNETISQLTKGFFSFYANFDYFNYVICPYLGQAVKKISFLEPYNLPLDFRSSDFQFTPNAGVCIQDPFDHAINVASTITLGKFGLLSRLSEEIMLQGELEMMYEVFVKSMDFKPHTQFQFEIVKPSDYDDQRWIDLVKSTVLTILEDVCNFVVKPATPKGDVFSYYCVGKNNVWINRTEIMKMVLRELPTETSEIELESSVTNCHIKLFPNPCEALLFLYLTFSKTPCKVVVRTEPKTKFKEFTHITYYLSIKLPQFLSEAMNDNPAREANGILDEEEDVPSDFFDDFSDEKFLDGLDISENWELDSGLLGSESTEKSGDDVTSPKEANAEIAPSHKSSDLRKKIKRLKAIYRRTQSEFEMEYSQKRKRSKGEKKKKKLLQKKILEIIKNAESGSQSAASLKSTEPDEEKKKILSDKILEILNKRNANPPSIPGPPDTELKLQDNDINKLFIEKKIPLSDFLSLTVKQKAQKINSPKMNTADKIISRCENAIKVMTDCAFAERFVVRHGERNPNSEVGSQHQSPLTTEKIRFHFTSLAKDIDPFLFALNKLLQRVDISEIPSVDEEFVAELTPHPDLICAQCKRNTIAQCASNFKKTVDIGVQVNEHEFPQSVEEENIMDTSPFKTKSSFWNPSQERTLHNKRHSIALFPCSSDSTSLGDLGENRHNGSIMTQIIAGKCNERFLFTAQESSGNLCFSVEFGVNCIGMKTRVV